MTAARGSREEVDVSTWAVIRYEQGGRDAGKRWLAKEPSAPRHQHWLWKGCPPTGDGSERALTDCSEVVVSRLAAAIGIPAAECRCATAHSQRGVISHNVAPDGYSMNTARAYLPEVDGYTRLLAKPVGGPGLMRRDQGYSLDVVAQVLRDVAAPPGISGLSGFDVFAGYLVLDALTGNSDRHPGNWALLESITGDRYLAPTYDHGSALGAGLTELNRSQRDPRAFASRGLANPFLPPKQRLTDLALAAVARTGQTLWLDRVASLTDAQIMAALEAPPGRMSEAASTFMHSVILENQRRLCDGDSGED